MPRPPAAALAALVASAAVSGPVPASAQAVGDATVVAFGAAPFRGSTEGLPVAGPPVALAPTPTGQGYWLAGADGGVFAFGDAPFAGSLGATRVNRPVVGAAPTPSGRGYWLVAADGGIFAFGDARFLGSLAGARLNQPVVGMAATPTGAGYWLVAADGGLFAFGDAGYLGSAGGARLNRPVVGMAATRSGRGYWLVAADGGLFAFGDARFLGSTGAVPLNRPVAGMAASPTGAGYWLVAADGGVFAFGDAPWQGAATGALSGGRQAVGLVGTPRGDGYWMLVAPPAAAAGAVGPGVEGMQRRLNELGYWGPVDGHFTALTLQQVYAFQKANGLPRDGQLDAAEMALLDQGVRPRGRGTSGYAVEVDKSRQLVLVVRDGVVEWVFNSSTGTNRPYRSAGGRGVAVTPEGQFRVSHQIDGTRVSPLGVLFRPKYFTGGYALHGSPSVPPFPASHGCVRVSNAAINFIWDHEVVPLGTPVFVYS